MGVSVSRKFERDKFCWLVENGRLLVVWPWSLVPPPRKTCVGLLVGGDPLKWAEHAKSGSALYKMNIAQGEHCTAFSPQPSEVGHCTTSQLIFLQIFPFTCCGRIRYSLQVVIGFWRFMPISNSKYKGIQLFSFTGEYFFSHSRTLGESYAVHCTHRAWGARASAGLAILYYMG